MNGKTVWGLALLFCVAVWAVIVWYGLTLVGASGVFIAFLLLVLAVCVIGEALRHATNITHRHEQETRDDRD